MENLGIKKGILILLGLIFLTDVAIFLNIPFMRPILGFLFLSGLPGLLILQILKLNKIGSTEKFVLSVGLSISFLMFFGLLLNNLLLALGYKSPLSIVPLLISFNVATIALTFVAYRTNKNSIFFLPDFNLDTSEKAFLIVPILFPALSIFVSYFMNTTNNNIASMFLLFLIPIYVIFVCFFNQKFPSRIYPLIISLISISLILMMALRSNHIMGIDTHSEYYLFQATLNNMYWSVFSHSTLDACLSISLLPTIYQLFLNVNPEWFFNIFYVLLFSLVPLVVFVISKKYVGDFYGFLASIFFIFQARFIFATGGARTNVAIFFFALAMMVLFNDKIEPMKKRILFIVFMASCMVSHYSTTYIFFFIVLGTFVGMGILSKKFAFGKMISLKMVILFFSMVFFWYSQVTETAFIVGVRFIETTFENLHNFFILELRGTGEALLGQGIMEKGIPHKIEFVFTWLTFAFIGIGIITLIRRYTEMSFPELKFKKPEFLKDKFEVGYFMIALVCSGLLVIMIALPFVAVGYALDRLYAVAITILSVFFVIGGIVLSKQTFKKSLIKKQKREGTALQNPGREGVGRENTSQIWTYLLILLILIPYFFCVTGVTYYMFGYPRGILLNSEGKEYDILYVYDQESYSAQWLKSNTDEKTTICADFYSDRRLISQGGITPSRIDYWWLATDPVRIDGYIYLRSANSMNGELVDHHNEVYDMADYSNIFFEKKVIYDSGCSKIHC